MNSMHDFIIKKVNLMTIGRIILNQKIIDRIVLSSSSPTFVGFFVCKEDDG